MDDYELENETMIELAISAALVAAATTAGIVLGIAAVIGSFMAVVGLSHAVTALFDRWRF